MNSTGLKTLIQDINGQIDQRRFYGMRSFTAPSDGHVLCWSNGGANWTRISSEKKKGTELRLDANMVFAPCDRERIDAILALDPQPLHTLPLYGLGLEGRTRGSGKTLLDWAVTQLISKA